MEALLLPIGVCQLLLECWWRIPKHVAWHGLPWRNLLRDMCAACNGDTEEWGVLFSALYSGALWVTFQ